MGSFFDIEGRFFRTLTKIADFLILDIILIIFCLPVITIGPALSAVYYVSLKEVKDEEGYVIKDFWKAFKQNFKQGVVIEIIYALVALFLYNDLKICYHWAISDPSIFPKLILFFLLGLILVAITIFIYTFPLIAKFNNSFVKVIINSLLMAMKHLPQSFVMIIINVFLIYATIMYPPLIVFSIGICLYANSYILVRIFGLYIPKEKSDPDEYHVSDIDEQSFNEQTFSGQSFGGQSLEENSLDENVGDEKSLENETTEEK